VEAIQKTLVLAVFSLSVVSWALGQDRGLEVVARAVGGADVKIGKQYAVLIGIDRYAEWPSLRNPVKDAKAITAILGRRYFIDDLINRVGPTDSVLIYFAGNGSPTNPLRDSGYPATGVRT
jgi:uncharacterized caspase-like protein